MVTIDIFDRRSIYNSEVAWPAVGSAIEFSALTIAKSQAPEEVIDCIERSGLVGKGGAAFPAFRKLDLMRLQASERKVLVVNGGEHEPGSLKDRYLLEKYPNTILEGALIAAYASGASDVIVAVADGMTGAIASFRNALRSYSESQTSGIACKLVPIQESYLAGEETALLELLEGRPALPRKRPPYPMQAGLYGLPTLVQNVETLAHIPFILAQGPAAYRSLGVGQAGVTLCTFGTEFANSGVRLVPLGISVGDLVYKAGGGLRSGKALKAVQPGGPGSGFLTSLQFDTPFAYDELKRSGSAVGCAAIRGYSDDDDVVHAVAEVMKFFAENSCGKCPQCRMETQMLSRIANQTLAGAGNQKLFKQIPTIINANVGRGICGLIKMPVAPMMTGLERFRGEFDNYVVDGGGSLTSAT